MKEIPIKPLILAAGFAALTYLGFVALGTERIRSGVAAAGPFGPPAFILLKASTNVIAPLSGTPFYLLAKPLFGAPLGLLYIFTGDVLGYSTCFLLARRFGPEFIRGPVGEKAAARIEQLYESAGGWKGLLYSRLFLLGVQDLISYAAGLTSMPFPLYVAVTSAGIIPQVFVAVLVGGTFVESSPTLAAVYVLITIALLAFWLYYRKRRPRR